MAKYVKNVECVTDWLLVGDTHVFWCMRDEQAEVMLETNLDSKGYHWIKYDIMNRKAVDSGYIDSIFNGKNMLERWLRNYVVPMDKQEWRERYILGEPVNNVRNRLEDVD